MTERKHMSWYSIGASGDLSFSDFAAGVNANHDRLAAMWPTVRRNAGALPDRDKIAWNALVYIQQGIEVQLAATAAKAGNGSYHQDTARALGEFAGLPGTGGGHDPNDPRFAVPRLQIYNGLKAVSSGDTIVGLAPLVIGAWVVVGIVAVIVLGLTVRSVAGILSGQTANIDNYKANMDARVRSAAAYQPYADSERRAGRTPLPIDQYVNAVVPPPPPPVKPAGFGLGFGLGLGTVAVLGGGYILTRRAA